LSLFFVRTANPTGGVITPIEVIVAEIVFGQKLGVITQAVIVNVMVFEML
jgi:hypothetical protein